MMPPLLLLRLSASASGQPPQDACKVVTYWLLRKYDIFQINSCALVNVRGAQTFNENPLARQSAGAVEVRRREGKGGQGVGAAYVQRPA
jgi:hypothetical protein